MHPAIQIDEICRLIAQECQGWQSTLCALAITCRAFSDPSLDTLWAELKSMVPLLLALPTGLVVLKPEHATRRRVIPKTMVYDFRRSLEQGDWDVFCRYSKRIRCFYGDLATEMDGTKRLKRYVSPNIFLALCAPPSGTVIPLFPKLRDLNWRPDAASFPFIRTLSNHALVNLNFGRRLAVQYTASSSEPLSFILEGNALEDLAEIGKLFPSIRTLTWIDPSFSHDIVTALSRAICSWRYLEDLSVAALDRTAFSHLIQLPALQHLQVHAPLREQMPVDEASPALEKSFPQLKSMRLEHCAHGLTDAALILAAIDGGVSFAEFFASTFGVPRDTDLHSLLRTVAEKCNTNTLTSLTVVEDLCTNPSLLTSSSFNITLATLVPVTSFRHLETLDIDTERNVSLGDSELLELASAWPRMKRLIINPLNGWRVPSRVTFHGLAALFGLLPQLQRLHIAIDGYSTTDVTTIQSRDTDGESLLEAVDLVDSRVGDNIMDIVACLMKALPTPRMYSIRAWSAVNLNVRSNMEPERGIFSKRWEEVFGVVNKMDSSRKTQLPCE